MAEPLEAQAVVERDDDESPGGERGAVEVGLGGGAEDVRAAVDPDEYGQAPGPSAGAQMFSVRMSSSPGDQAGEPGSSADWGATGPNAVHSRTPSQGCAGRGSRNRSAPNGGAA
ncbi:hypothetical protein Smic_73710 [Streptomyces microflavus]|uniref:Uncharacterized protein n=1 Tax=Streptomyces microflavus TaxID=1919 RepID=A0A7J0D4D4_STRMI|nr:hypothetical protein Smic_73710 [Streptomyces microflavus]